MARPRRLEYGARAEADGRGRLGVRFGAGGRLELGDTPLLDRRAQRRNQVALCRRLVLDDRPGRRQAGGGIDPRLQRRRHGADDSGRLRIAGQLERHHVAQATLPLQVVLGGDPDRGARGVVGEANALERRPLEPRARDRRDLGRASRRTKDEAP